MKINEKSNKKYTDNSPIYKNKFNTRIKDKIKKISYKTIILTLYLLVLIFMLYLNLKNNSINITLIFELILLSSISIMCLKFTNIVFLFNHFFSVNNISEDDMSDTYNIYIKLVGIGFSLYILFILIQSL